MPEKENLITEGFPREPLPSNMKRNRGGSLSTAPFLVLRLEDRDTGGEARFVVGPLTNGYRLFGLHRDGVDPLIDRADEREVDEVADEVARHCDLRSEEVVEVPSPCGGHPGFAVSDCCKSSVRRAVVAAIGGESRAAASASLFEWAPPPGVSHHVRRGALGRFLPPRGEPWRGTLPVR